MKYEDLVAFLKASRLTATDNVALKAKELYPTWKESLTVAVGDRYQYGETLYKCIQAHTTQADWTPDITPSLWAVIDETHEGTLEDPIPAVRGMEYVYGKYYIEEEKIYLCTRQGATEGDVIRLDYLPSELIGQYFALVE